MEKPKVLKQEEINEGLKALPGWTYADDKISKEYKYSDFLDALRFISRLSDYFETMDHHPDMHIYYNRIVFELHRFDIGGKVTDRDIEVAHAIEEEYSSR